MNTPKFQVRKLQRQMMNERDYRDGLERELSSKLRVIAQKGNRSYTFGTSVLDLTCIHIFLCAMFLYILLHALMPARGALHNKGFCFYKGASVHLI